MTESELSLKRTSKSVAETRGIGACFGKALVPGTLISLQGTLGAGKTNFVQAIASGLKIDAGTVVSPTFTLIQLYAGTSPLVHIDAYRIADEDQYLELGIDEYIDDPESIVAMEWGEKFKALMPRDRIDVVIDVSSEFGRSIRFQWPDSPGTASASMERFSADASPA